MLSSNRTILTVSFVIILNMSTSAHADSIQNHCKGIVGGSYSLMETCVRGEEEARARLQSRSIDPQIKSHCKKIVGRSYKLMETCIRREEEARSNLQSRQTDSQEDADVPNDGEKGKLVSMLVDYADLRERVQEVRQTRKSGYASDTKDLIDLARRIGERMVAADKFRHSVHVAGMTDNQLEVTASNLLYAYSTMNHIVNAEIDRNLYLQKSDMPLRIAEKYEEIWKMVDPSIPVVQFP